MLLKCVWKIFVFEKEVQDTIKYVVTCSSSGFGTIGIGAYIHLQKEFTRRLSGTKTLLPLEHFVITIIIKVFKNRCTSRMKFEGETPKCKVLRPIALFWSMVNTCNKLPNLIRLDCLQSLLWSRKVWYYCSNANVENQKI